mmetsp:Transcript_23498/g.23708  ORF Transcript_23498/g.23708 Transcript_23498/m.23708 type:complete len:217 (+) Transcript_23498:42-692(+)
MKSKLFLIIFHLLWLKSLCFFPSPKIVNFSTFPPLRMSRTEDDKAALVSRLLSAKEASHKSFDDIAAELGLTNAYTVQLFMNQAQLKAVTAEKLSKIVPGISSEDLKVMQYVPIRSFDTRIIQEPLIYRLGEIVQHYGQGLKELVNEKLGDGIISAIDIFVTLDTIKGLQGEDRVVVTLNGKFLPHIEQKSSMNTVTVSYSSGSPTVPSADNIGTP